MLKNFQLGRFLAEKNKCKTDEEIDDGENPDDEVAKDTVSDNDTPPKEYEDDEEQREEIEDNVGVDEGLFNA